MKSELITRLNTQLAMIDTDAIKAHTEKGDLEAWIWDWRVEMAALSFALYLKIYALTDGKG